MAKPRLISGIQPTGKLHIGNYLGALKNFVALQNSGDYECYFSVVDLHSLTEPFSPEEKRRQILDLTADYLAAGIDSHESVLFLQSQVSAHSELVWILNTITPLGQLEGMTQFKDRAFKHVPSEMLISGTMSPDEIKKYEGEKIHEHTRKIVNQEIRKHIYVGILDYPVLMAADILLYDAKFVPVGDDQLQHLELARTLARKFNAKFGDTFVEPQPLLTKTPRVMSLDDPSKKMSKSSPKGCLFLDDSSQEIEKKIKVAVTDSGTAIAHNPKTRPAISNLVEIYAAFREETVKNTEKRFKGKSYAEFKAALAELVSESLKNFRQKKADLIKDEVMLVKTLKEGSLRAEKIASAKIAEVKKQIGISL